MLSLSLSLFFFFFLSLSDPWNAQDGYRDKFSAWHFRVEVLEVKLEGWGLGLRVWSLGVRV